MVFKDRRVPFVLDDRHYLRELLIDIIQTTETSAALETVSSFWTYRGSIAFNELTTISKRREFCKTDCCAKAVAETTKLYGGGRTN